MPSLPICRLRPRISATFAVVAAFALRGALALAAALTTSCGHSSPPAAPAPKSDDAADLTAQLEARLAALEASAERSRALEGVMVDLLGRLQKLEGAAAAGTPPRAPSRPPGPNPQLTYAIPVDGSPTAGRADAKVTLVEGYEYACYYCNKARATLDELARKYGDDLRIVRKHFVVHQQSAVAPALAACAAHKQQRFAAMDQLLWDKVYATKTFDDEDCWDTAQGCPVVLALARELALDVAKFRADMRGDCQRVLAGDAELLRKLGMSGTPGFFINGRWISGAQPLETFTTLIDEELRKANERISAGTPRARYYQTWVLDRGVKVSDPRPPVRADVAELLREVPGQGKLFAEIATSMGTLRCELFPDAAPLTVANFIGLATGKKSWSQKGKTQIGKPFYDGLTFHRVIPGFMIQGGCPVGDGTGDPGYQFVNEASLPVAAGALAMANAGPDTNGSQFFITETARHELDGKYTVFGQCSEAEIVRAISAVARDGADRPLRPVTIDRISFSRR